MIENTQKFDLFFVQTEGILEIHFTIFRNWIYLKNIDAYIYTWNLCIKFLHLFLKKKKEIDLVSLSLYNYV